MTTNIAPTIKTPTFHLNLDWNDEWNKLLIRLSCSTVGIHSGAIQFQFKFEKYENIHKMELKQLQKMIEKFISISQKYCLVFHKIWFRVKKKGKTCVFVFRWILLENFGWWGTRERGGKYVSVWFWGFEVNQQRKFLLSYRSERLRERNLILYLIMFRNSFYLPKKHNIWWK